MKIEHIPAQAWMSPYIDKPSVVPSTHPDSGSKGLQKEHKVNICHMMSLVNAVIDN